MLSAPLLLLAFLLVASSALDLSLPSAHYQQDIIFAEEEVFGTHRSIPAASPFSADFGFQPAGNFQTPAFGSAGLFTPNTVQQPAETPGQIEEYRKALEEEEREREREENRIGSGSRGGLGEGVKGYVNVRMGEGAKGVQYGYTI